jgi:hypothetical protein
MSDIAGKFADHFAAIERSWYSGKPTMKELENENRELKDEIERLRVFVDKFQALCCDGVVSWSLLTKEYMSEVVEAYIAATGDEARLEDTDE